MTPMISFFESSHIIMHFHVEGLSGWCPTLEHAERLMKRRWGNEANPAEKIRVRLVQGK